MIRIENLRKTFKGKPALHGLSLEVRRGEIFGLLGHNGAGKSTTFGILLGQVYPDAGEAFISDISVQRERSRALARVGAIFEAPAFFDYLSGWRNLEILSSYSGRISRKEIQEAVDTVGLTARIQDPVRTYSHGMRQRLGLAQALIPMPELILLDEPTEGLDPEGIHEIRNLILRLNRERGLTVLFSSHLLAEVEHLCDRVAILNRGHLVYEGRWQELAGRGSRYRIEVDDWDRATGVLPPSAKVIVDTTVELDPGSDVADLVASLVHAGIKIRAVEPLKPNLESLYLDAISRQREQGNVAAPIEREEVAV
ncbi:ABC transporter ATP-binding protein [Verrucomicrobiota bacterium sgz303538]